MEISTILKSQMHTKIGKHYSTERGGKTKQNKTKTQCEQIDVVRSIVLLSNLTLKVAGAEHLSPESTPLQWEI